MKMKNMKGINEIIDKLGNLGKVAGDNESLSHKDTLEAYFAEAGHPMSLKNNNYEPLHKAGECARHLVYNFNKTHMLKVTNEDVYSTLGAELSMQTHPSERKNMQDLADLMFKSIPHGRDPYKGFVGTPLYNRVKDRSTEYGIPLEEYMEAIGYPRQNAKLNGRKVVTTETHEDVISSIQDVLDKALKKKGKDGKYPVNPPTPLNAETLRELGIYNWLRHKRDATGLAMDMSIETFIDTQLKGYMYSGQETIQNTDRSTKGGVKSVVLPSKGD